MTARVAMYEINLLILFRLLTAKSPVVLLTTATYLRRAEYFPLVSLFVFIKLVHSVQKADY